MQKSISLLGSTGSIGRQTLDVAAALGIRVSALSADKNITLLEEQVRRFKPLIAAVTDETAARDFKTRVRDTSVRVVSGPQGLIDAACVSDVGGTPRTGITPSNSEGSNIAGSIFENSDTASSGVVVTAVSGMAGLLPTLAAISMGKRIALANKESLVYAGEIVMSEARRYGSEIIPVDSEHSAVFQCLLSGRGEGYNSNHSFGCGEVYKAGRGEKHNTKHSFEHDEWHNAGRSFGRGEHHTAGRSGVKKIILTASGGPFRGMSREELRKVTPPMALAHPTWKMGRKITIDSATLMNKGFEVIEAVHLFGMNIDNVDVVVHPESIIHSMVEYIDNSVVAQLAIPDMRLAIQYALTFPAREVSPIAGLDFSKIAALTFEKPDTTAFPCLDLARAAAKKGGAACAVLCGANDAAIDLFLDGRLSFCGISDAVAAALESIAAPAGNALFDSTPSLTGNASFDSSASLEGICDSKDTADHHLPAAIGVVNCAASASNLTHTVDELIDYGKAAYEFVFNQSEAH